MRFKAVNNLNITVERDGVSGKMKRLDRGIKA